MKVHFMIMTGIGLTYRLPYPPELRLLDERKLDEIVGRHVRSHGHDDAVMRE